MQDPRKIRCNEYFIRIQHVRRIPEHGFRDTEQGLLLEQIIVIKQHYKLARRHFECTVGGMRDATVLGSEM